MSTTMDLYGEVLPQVDEGVARDVGALFGDSLRDSDTAASGSQPYLRRS